jgi:hypothetical protein
LFKFENCSDFVFVQIGNLFRFSNLKIFQKSSRKKKKKEEIPDGLWPSLPPVHSECAAHPSRAANGRHIGGPIGTTHGVEKKLKRHT